jgi:hypothetical protein
MLRHTRLTRVALFGVLGVAGSLPGYSLTNTASGATVKVTDPGKALITGSWLDVGKTKGPNLPGLAAQRRSSTTVRRRISARSSSSTTPASTSALRRTRSTISLRS